ncbi:MAG: VapE domain-containing protein [Burkholderiales bacterium]
MNPENQGGYAPQNPKLTAALAYQSEGFVVLPIKPGGKEPILPKWPTLPAPSMADIEAWFGGQSNRNIGIRTGGISGIFVLDVDAHKGGLESLKMIEETYDALPHTAIQFTPNGGRHYVFQIPPELHCRNSASAIAPGLDIRADGGQIVVCPSTAPNTITGDHIAYAWDGGAFPSRAELALVPDWLIQLVKDARKQDRAQKNQPADHKVHTLVHIAGSRNDALFRRAAAMRAQGLHPDAILAALRVHNNEQCKPPLEDTEIQAIAVSACRYEPEPAYERTWMDGLQISRKKYKGIKSNLVLFLQNDQRIAGKISYNELTKQVETTSDVPWKKMPGVHSDYDELRMRSWFANFMKLGYPMDEVGRSAGNEAICEAAHANPFHPIQEWLKGLQWDGFPRVNDFLADAWSLEKSNYLAAVSRVILIGSVQRIMSPGCEMQYMPIIEGATNLGKSTFLQMLFHPWHSEKNGSQFGSPDSIREMQGKWVIEVQELNVFTKTEVNTMKGFISIRNDRYVEKWEKTSQEVPRSSLYIGTTNESECLRDTTGNRRFLMVKVANRMDIGYIRAWRDLLFAEAYQRRNESIVVPEESQPDAEQLQEDAMVEDPWADIIGDWLDLNHNTYATLYMQEILANVLKIEKGRQTPRDQSRVKAILGKFGWSRVKFRVMKKLKWGYKRNAEN